MAGDTLTLCCIRRKGLSAAFLLLGLLVVAQAQSYKVGSDSATASPTVSQNETHPLGWGSNIQNARLAGAAEEALRNGKYSAAADYAQRAAQAAPNDPQLWLLLGYSARLAGKLQVSVEAYSHALRVKPGLLEGLSGLAQTYSSMGRQDEALHLLTQTLAIDPKRVNDAALLGEMYVQLGQYKDALSVLGRTDQIQPSARTELLIALSYRHLKQLDQANRYLELAKHRAPDDPEVQRSLAGFYRETGNYPAAIAALQALPHKNQDELAELAYTYQLSGQTEESARLYAQAADAAPQDIAIQLSAAQAEVTAGTSELAERFLQRAVAGDPQHYRLHAIRGEIAWLQDDPATAIREFNTALDRLPQEPTEGPLYVVQLRMNLMEVNKSLSDDDAAQSQLQIAQTEISKLDEQGPNRPDFLRLRALIKLNAGDLQSARDDLREALSINSDDPNALQLDGELLAKLGRNDEALAVYSKVLAIDPQNRAALTALGYLARTMGNDQDAEKYFQRLAAVDPKTSIPYQALGDLYTSRRDFAKAETSYRKAYALAPSSALTIAGGMNAAIEAHHFPVAAEWLSRATSQAQKDPQVLRETERYLNWIGEYQQSEAVGKEAIKKLPHDRDVVVYLGYDMLRLEKYDQLLELALHYDALLPKEPDIPLFVGYVHKHAGLDEKAEQDFTRVLERGPNVVTAYVNRGYVRNDLHKSAGAAFDFEAALRLEPKNGDAHLGLAFANLGLHLPKAALRQAQLAEQQLGDSTPLHLIRATAYGELGIATKAAQEYRAALKALPNDSRLHWALADTLYGLHQYSEAVTELQAAEHLSARNSQIEARLARSYGQLKNSEQTMRYVHLAEHDAKPEEQTDILVTTGEALSLLGDEKAAMERFEKALTEPGNDRVGVRIAVARLEASQGRANEAHRQIALAFMEARTGEAQPATENQILAAADVFLSAHDFSLAEKYFSVAVSAGAPETAVRVGLANTYLEQGDTARAEGQIAAISGVADSDPNYQYLLAKAGVYRQQHQNVRALTAFAQAASAAGEDETAEHELLQAASDEGLRLNRAVSFLSSFSVAPIFEDTTVYPLDAKLDVGNPVPGQQNLLPLPRSSLETQWTGAYHLHLNGFPSAGGFFQVRNAQGEISLPNADAIINRNTTDYSFNVGLSPTVRLGNDVLTFSTGIQETIRRDSRDPLDMDQNLFRQFAYLSTSAFYNLVSVNGYAIHESGPFTLSDMHSRLLAAALEFKVGRPWGKTALVTGWGASDNQFSPVIREFFYTSSYLGMERQLTQKLRTRLVAEDVRSWRVEEINYGIAQALRPAGSVEYSPTRNWSMQGSVAYSRNMGFHAYDAVQSGFSISYAKSIGRIFKDDVGDVNLRYPIRFSAGLLQEDFFNFTGGNSQQLRPYFSLSLF